MVEKLLFYALGKIIELIFNKLFKELDEYKEESERAEEERKKVEKRVKALKDAKTTEEFRTAIRRLRI